MRSSEFRNGAPTSTSSQLILYKRLATNGTQPINHYWDVVPDILKSQLSKDERMGIAVQVRLDNDEIEVKLTKASRAEQISWCEDAPAKIISPQMSLMNRPALLQAVTTF